MTSFSDLPNLQPGDRIDVVLDLVPEVRDGVVYQRVFLRGVFPPGAGSVPPLVPGAIRNRVQWWYGTPSDQNHMAAFAIDTGPEVEA